MTTGGGHCDPDPPACAGCNPRQETSQQCQCNRNGSKGCYSIIAGFGNTDKLYNPAEADEECQDS